MESFDGEVKDLTQQGLGVVQAPDGRVFFVPGAWPGDRGRFRPGRLDRRYGFAVMEECMEPSQARRPAPCPHHGWTEGSCGGCPWMMATYEAQLEAKQRTVETTLLRAGLLRGLTIPELIPSTEWAYRGRAQLKTDGETLGYVSAQSNTIAKIKECLVLNKGAAQRLAELQEQLPQPEWSPGAGQQWTLVEIEDDRPKASIGKPLPFRQGNPSQNQVMKDLLGQWVKTLPRNYAVLELFAGSGNLTEVWAELGFESITAVESDTGAVALAKKKALPRVTCIRADLRQKSHWKRIPREVRILLLDPSRQGFRPIGAFVNERRLLQKIFYVSCDLGSFARDGKELAQQGWQLDRLQPIDFFPQTPHVELVSEWSKKELRPI